MPTLFIPAPLRDHCGGAERITLEAPTLRGLIRALEERFPGAAERLLVDDAPRPGWAFAVDGVMTKALSARLGPTAEVHIVPAVGGG